MTIFRNTLRSGARLMLAVAVAGCTKWKSDEAPAGFAIVREHVIEAPRNHPPIRSALDFTLVAIDGAPVVRETIPPWVDLQRGALLAAGTHTFKALVSPHIRSPDQPPQEISFVATVESRTVYFLIEKNAAPVLVEARSR